MIDAARSTVLIVSAILLSGGAALSVGLLATPSETGSDYGLDTNGNGRYDWLVVVATVALPDTGFWDIGATLFSRSPPSGGSCGAAVPQPLLANPFAPATWPIAYAYERYFFEAGTQTVRIAFAGTDIFRAGVDGPYDVQMHLSISGGIVYADGSILPGPMPPAVEWKGVTGDYRASDFEEPVRPAYFTGGHTDVGVHVDGDGLYDFLEIRADVHVNVAGVYNLYAALTSQVYTADAWRVAIGYGYRDTFLDLGGATVPVRIRGDQIRAAGIDGPWDFMLTLSGGYSYREGDVGVNGTVVDGRPIAYYPETLCGSTQAYPASEFDDTVELLRYTGIVEEIAEDVDGDGRYEALHLRAEVDVLVSGGFDQRGELQSEDGSRPISGFWTQTWLAEGLGWTEWYFPGGDIAASGLDGPYRAVLSITPIYAGLDPTMTYRTKAYRASEFGGSATNRTGYWIGSLAAEATSLSSLAVRIEVQRGNDFLTYVIEDMLTTTVYDESRNVVFRAVDRVYLPSGGSVQYVGYSVDNLASGTYTVVAVLGPEDAPVDTRSVTAVVGGR